MLSKFKIFISKKDYGYFAFYFILMLGATFFELLGIGSIPIFLMSILNQEKLMSYIPIELFNEIPFILEKNFQLIVGISLVIIFILKNFYLIYFNYFGGKLKINLRKKIKNKVLKGYIFSDYKFHLNENPAELTRNIISDCISSVEFIFRYLAIAKEIILFIFILILLVLVSPNNTFFVFLILSFVSYLFIAITKKKIVKTGKILHIESGRALKILGQIFGSIKELKILNKENFAINHYNQIIRKEEYNKFIAGFLQSLPRYILEIMSVICIMILTIFLIKSNTQIDLVIPIMSLFVISIVRLIPAYNSFMQSLSAARHYKYSFEIICNDLENNKSHEDKEFQNIIEKQKKIDSIEIKNLNFSYIEGKKTLKDINIKITKNSKIGIVGSSGAGKSTLIDIFVCLHKPSSGEILANGKSVHENRIYWQKKIGYVPQNIYLLDDTIKNNIAYGIDKEFIDNKKIEYCIKNSQLSEFINSLPLKEETIIGNNGVRISGGQKQRIGIARALYTDPEIIVFDEATSSLDEENENRIMQDIDTLNYECIKIIVTHRLKTVKNCDEIYVLNNGLIIDHGKFNDLKNRGIL